MSENTEKKQRLLIVDDSKVIRVTARKILRDHFETIEAVDGENAWELLSGEETFALVVSDLTMPRLDGFGLLERIRSSHLPQVRELPVIIITGANDTDAFAGQRGILLSACREQCGNDVFGNRVGIGAGRRGKADVLAL